MTVEQIQNMTILSLKKAMEEDFPPEEKTLQILEEDPRSGVRELALQIRRRQRGITREKARMDQMGALENKLRERGLAHIAGVDEAGRGPLAGPVTAAAVIFPENVFIPGINDSKKLSRQIRETLFTQIQANALAIGIGQATPKEIDDINIRNATHLAMRRAIDQLALQPHRVLVDGNAVPESGYPEMAIVGGDRKSISIAAASIIAKVTRDTQMVEYDKEYPGYGFANHKGYGSAEHLAALRSLGASPIHRRSFAGVPEHHATYSEDFQVFADGILSAGTVEQLSAMGVTIARISEDLPDDEVGALRDVYRKRRATLLRPGNQGEALATAYLKQHGFKILENNYRTVGGEIDIIAQKGDVLSFIEVKTAARPNFGEPQTWVTRKKQRQIIRIARAYLNHHKNTMAAPRFDVVTVDLTSSKPKIGLIEAAFSEGP